MPRKGDTIISINTSPEEQAAVNLLAKERGFRFTSDYLRHLIEVDAAAHGNRLKFSVNRGGYREREATKPDHN